MLLLMTSVGKIVLTYYKASNIHVSTSELKFIRLDDPSVSDHAYILDIFLQIAWPLKTPTPGCSDNVDHLADDIHRIIPWEDICGISTYNRLTS